MKLQSAFISNDPHYDKNMSSFLNRNQNIEIVSVINHKPYATTIIYKELEPEKEEGIVLSEKAKEKLTYILGRDVVRGFPSVYPDRLWAGAVLDLLEEIGLYND